MTLEAQLHFISSVVILLAAAVPIYLTIKLKGDLRRLTATLSVFIFVHAVYQIVSFFGLNILADSVFEPLSAAVLLFFGLTYYGQAKPRKDMSMSNMVVMSPATLLLFMNSLTIILLVAALGLLVWIATTQSKKIRSFQFQLAIFIIIWIAGDLLTVLNNNATVLFPSLPYLGELVHVASMFFLSIMLWLRYYYSERSSKRIIEMPDVK